MEDNVRSMPSTNRPQAPYMIGLPGMSRISGDVRQPGAVVATTTSLAHGATPSPSGSSFPEHLTLSRTTGPRGRSRPSSRAFFECEDGTNDSPTAGICNFKGEVGDLKKSAEPTPAFESARIPQSLEVVAENRLEGEVIASDAAEVKDARIVNDPHESEMALAAVLGDDDIEPGAAGIDSNKGTPIVAYLGSEDPVPVVEEHSNQREAAIAEEEVNQDHEPSASAKALHLDDVSSAAEEDSRSIDIALKDSHEAKTASADDVSPSDHESVEEEPIIPNPSAALVASSLVRTYYPIVQPSSIVLGKSDTAGNGVLKLEPTLVVEKNVGAELQVPTSESEGSPDEVTASMGDVSPQDNEPAAAEEPIHQKPSVSLVACSLVSTYYPIMQRSSIVAGDSDASRKSAFGVESSEAAEKKNESKVPTLESGGLSEGLTALADEVSTVDNKPMIIGESISPTPSAALVASSLVRTYYPIVQPSSILPGGSDALVSGESSSTDTTAVLLPSISNDLAASTCDLTQSIYDIAASSNPIENPDFLSQNLAYEDRDDLYLAPSAASVLSETASVSALGTSIVSVATALIQSYYPSSAANFDVTPSVVRLSDEEARRVFASIDVDKSGAITMSEFMRFYKKASSKGSLREELDFFSSLDLNGNAEIDLDEFITGWQHRDQLRFLANRQDSSVSAATTEVKVAKGPSSKAPTRQKVLESVAKVEDGVAATLAARTARMQTREKREIVDKVAAGVAKDAVTSPDDEIAPEVKKKTSTTEAVATKAVEVEKKSSKAVVAKDKVKSVPSAESLGVEVFDLSSDEEEGDDAKTDEATDVESLMAPTLRDALEAVRNLTLTLDHTHTRANARTVRDHEVASSASTDAATTSPLPPWMFSLPGQSSLRVTVSSEQGAIVTAAPGVASRAPAVLPPRCGHRHRDGIDDSVSRLHRNFSNRIHHAQGKQLELIQASAAAKPPKTMSRVPSTPKPAAVASSSSSSLNGAGRHNPVLAMLAQRKKALAGVTLSSGSTNGGGQGSADESNAAAAGGGGSSKQSIAATLDLRSLKVAESRAWSRLEHLTGSLASAGDHCTRTLDNSGRLATTLPPEAIPSAPPPAAAATAVATSDTANDGSVAEATGKGLQEGKQANDDGTVVEATTTQGEALARIEEKEGEKAADISSANEPKKRFGKGQGGSGGKSSASQTRTVLGTAVTNFAKQCRESNLAPKSGSKAEKEARDRVAATAQALAAGLTVEPQVALRYGDPLAPIDQMMETTGLLHDANNHRPLPTHQAQRVLFALDEQWRARAAAELAAATQAKSEAALALLAAGDGDGLFEDAPGLIDDDKVPSGDGGGCAASVLAMLRLLPVLRDPSVALKEQLWNAASWHSQEAGHEKGGAASSSSSLRAEEVWRAGLEVLSGADECMACLKEGGFSAELEKLGQLLVKANSVHKQIARLHAAITRARLVGVQKSHNHAVSGAAVSGNELAKHRSNDSKAGHSSSSNTNTATSGASAGKIAALKSQRLGLELELGRLTEDVATTTQALRQAHDSASALCRATKLRLATPGAPLSSPHTLKGVVNRAAARAAPKKKNAPGAAGAVTRSSSSSASPLSTESSSGGGLLDDQDDVTALLRRPLMAAASKFLDMLARRLLGAEALVNLAGAAAKHAEEANKELHRIAKLTKQLKAAEVEFANWRSGQGGLADIASSNAQLLRQVFLGAQPGSTSNSYHDGGNGGSSQNDKENGGGRSRNDRNGGSGSVSAFTVNPLFKNAEGAVAAQVNGMAYREESSAQADRRTALFLNQLFILRDVRWAGNNDQNQASKSRKKNSVDDDEDEGEENENGEETKRSSEDDEEEEEDSESADDSESEDDDDSDNDESVHSAEGDDELGVFSDKKNENEATKELSEGISKIPGKGTSSGQGSVHRLRPPRRLRFEDMTLSMRKRLGCALHDGGAHFVFGGSRCAHLRRESPRDALMRHDAGPSASTRGGKKSGHKKTQQTELAAADTAASASAGKEDEWFKARSSIGTRRVCGEEWLSTTTGGRAGSVGRSSMTRASMGRSSLGRAITASLARPGGDARVSESVARISASIARSDKRSGPV